MDGEFTLIGDRVIIPASFYVVVCRLDSYDFAIAGKPLTEAQLLAFCHSPPDDPVRGHLLTVRRISRGKRSKPLHQIFGEDPPIPPTPSLGMFLQVRIRIILAQ